MKYKAHVEGVYPERFNSLKAARAWIRTRSVRDGAEYCIERADEPNPLKRGLEYGELWRGRMFRDR